MGKQSYVRLVEHGKQQSPQFLLLLACCSQTSPMSSTVSNLNSENPPGSKFEKLFAVSHQLLLHRLRRVCCGAERQSSAHKNCFPKHYAELIIQQV